MIIMSVDLGMTRTGLAVCDKSENFVFPRGILKIYDREKLFSAIAQKAAEEKAELIVIGLPKNMDGSEGEKAQESYVAAERIRALSGLETALYDERCTTISAHTDLRMNGVMGKNRKNVVDTVAATLILEDYLKFRKSSQP